MVSERHLCSSGGVLVVSDPFDDTSQEDFALIEDSRLARRLSGAKRNFVMFFSKTGFEKLGKEISWLTILMIRSTP
ncbi:hypothetical protein CASFOL_013933 [Castilleja foliolosa]|uniref:Uncharacterized protein n=1 Tax=Castilleja foliolosa TaxID=1961234 RepID=A0ABD3DLF6_9LAMI